MKVLAPLMALSFGLAVGYVGLSPWLWLIASVAVSAVTRRLDLTLLFCLACLRAATVTTEGPPTFPRGGAHMELRVAGLAQPGPRCRVPVATAAGEEPLRLVLATGTCRWVPGDWLVVPVPGTPARRTRAGIWELHRDRALLRRSEQLDAMRRGWRIVADRRAAVAERAGPEAEDALTAAAALGLRSLLARDQVEALRLAGLGHLLAVSGLHVGLLAWFVLRCFRAACSASMRGQWFAWFAGACPIVVYVVSTGAAPSAIRAGLMVLAFSLGGLFGRPVSRSYLLWGSGLLMLLVWPRALFELGFQLSFVAMACVLGASSIWQMQWRLAWGLAGLNLLHFGYVSWVGWILNLVAVPIFSFTVLPFALLGWAWPGVVLEGATELARPGARVLLDLAQLAARCEPMGWTGVAIMMALGMSLRVGLRLVRRRGATSTEDSTSPAWGVPSWALGLGLWGLLATRAGEADEFAFTNREGSRLVLARAGTGQWCARTAWLVQGETARGLVEEARWTLPSTAWRELLASGSVSPREGLSSLRACERGMVGALAGDEGACIDARGCWRAARSGEP